MLQPCPRRALLLLTLCIFIGCDGQAPEPASVQAVSPPIPALAVTPTPQQLAWQQGEMYLFIHFGINTFTGREWGAGHEDPALFDPPAVDADQWARVAKEAGFQGIVFTAKHHEGFALWPTALSDYSIRRSPWQNGQGNVVQRVAEACRTYGLKFGIYLSPWDRNEPSYGTPAYDDFFVGQLTELLTQYGPVFEVWFDGAREAGISFEYDWNRYYETVRQHQPDALIAIVGPDIRWSGNEEGWVPETLWSPVDGRWHPVECNAPNRPHWFWKAAENSHVKSVEDHVAMYFRCVGRNGTLLLNAPPNDKGVIPHRDVERLLAFRHTLDALFDDDLAHGAHAWASSTWRGHTAWSAAHATDGNERTFWAAAEEATTATLELDLWQAKTFDIVELAEPIQFGQRVAAYRVEAFVRGGWRTVARGTTIGHKRLHRLNRTRAQRVRLVIEKAKASPALHTFSLYHSVFER